MLRLLALSGLLLFAACAPRTPAPLSQPERAAFEPEPVEPEEPGTIDPEADVEVIEVEVDDEDAVDGEEEPPTPPTP
jgi:hypothetical protein